MPPIEEHPFEYPDAQGFSKRSGMIDAPPRHPDIAASIHGIVIDDNGEAIRVMIDARDCTGIISSVSEIAKKYDINITTSNTFRMGDLFSETVLFIVGTPEQIKHFEEDLKQFESHPITGKQILPAELFDIRIECQDRVGMLYDVSSILKDHDINIVTMGTRTIAENLIDVEQTAEARDRAFIHMRIEVPEERLEQMDKIERQLRQIDFMCELSITRWLPKKTKSPSTNYWPLELN